MMMTKWGCRWWQMYLSIPPASAHYDDIDTNGNDDDDKNDDIDVDDDDDKCTFQYHRHQPTLYRFPMSRPPNCPSAVQCSQWKSSSSSSSPVQNVRPKFQDMIIPWVDELMGFQHFVFLTSSSQDSISQPAPQSSISCKISISLFAFYEAAMEFQSILSKFLPSTLDFRWFCHRQLHCKP